MEDSLKSFGRYVVIGRLGGGAMADLYLAEDPSLGRRVAIKILRDLSGSGREFEARFLREGRATAHLDHPAIVKVFDFGVQDGRPFIIQEFLDGKTLAELLQDGLPITTPAVLAILELLASGLEHAHASGVIHRDIKPHNVILTRKGEIKVLDFGIARMANEQGGDLTQEGMMIGTPMYMSPEQIEGTVVTAAADIWSFGILAFELVAGTPAYSAESSTAIMYKVMSGPPSMDALGSDCPPSLRELIERCLLKEPSARWPSMSAVRERIRLAAQEIGVQDLGEPRRLVEAFGTIPDRPDDELSARWSARGATTDVGPADAQSALSGTVVLPHDGLDTYVPSRAEPHRGTPADTEDLPRQLDRFTLLRFIASGRTGPLYKAYDPYADKLVGLKVVDDSDSGAQRRLLRGAGIWLELTHVNLAGVKEVVRQKSDCPALVVTELIEGIDLRRLLEQRNLTLEEKVRIVLHLCEALEYLHESDVVHREVKPANLLVRRKPLKATLLDSGVARRPETDETQLTQTGLIVGDLAYMAPEQALGEVDQRSDVYSAGMLLCELIADEKPRAGDREQIAKAVEEANAPGWLKRLALKAIRQIREERFSSAAELADCLRYYVERQSEPAISKTVVTLHGIRTRAAWQRIFSEVAPQRGLHALLDHWNFGWFSILQFLSPLSRTAKVNWFRDTYNEDFGHKVGPPLSGDQPSIAAHSFGTYVLGNALLRYPYLRFGKVLLCGSILPRDFPWDDLIRRGQVQEVRNEYGARDIWTRLAPWFVSGTGASGIDGFEASHERLVQERFDFSHSEYFERGHMQAKWLPFLAHHRDLIPEDPDVDVRSPRPTRPLGLYGVYLLVLAAAALVAALKWWS